MTKYSCRILAATVSTAVVWGGALALLLRWIPSSELALQLALWSTIALNVAGIITAMWLVERLDWGTKTTLTLQLNGQFDDESSPRATPDLAELRQELSGTPLLALGALVESELVWLGVPLNWAATKVRDAQREQQRRHERETRQAGHLSVANEAAAQGALTVSDDTRSGAMSQTEVDPEEPATAKSEA